MGNSTSSLSPLPPRTFSKAGNLENGKQGRVAALQLGEAVALRAKKRGLRDPADIARLYGVRSVETSSSLVEDGRVEWAGDELRILVKRTDSKPRRRFTIAHELGHVLFGVQRNESRNNPEEETRCNRFAVGLLLPSRPVRELYASLLGRSLAARVVALAQAFDVSYDTTVIRMQELDLLAEGEIVGKFEESSGTYLAKTLAYDRRRYARLESRSVHQLGIADAVARLLDTPRQQPEYRTRVQLPMRPSRGYPSGRNFSVGAVSAIEVAIRPVRTVVIGLAPVVDPLEQRYTRAASRLELAR